uniref:peptidylprolyl isomerase n=1 Tax=Oryza brachyantha TaxID=4533 RepID=J3L133_ORYBR
MTEKIDRSFDMELSELGEPDHCFSGSTTDDGIASLDVSQRGTDDDDADGSPGLFAKWIVQQAAATVPHGEEKDEFYYCDEAQVHFTGKRLDGSLFASSREDGVPLTFIIGQDDVMQGFSMAINSMQPGEKAIFTIPSELVGTKSAGCPASIPANIPLDQAVRFDIELISLVTISEIVYNEGILKKTIKHGMGNIKPCGLDEVIVNYNVSLEDGTSVSMSDSVEFNVAKGFFCPAFPIAVKTMREGEEAVLIVKPEYGFGKQGRPSIGNEAAVPPDATLYVYIQLKSYKTVIHIGEGQTIFKKTLRAGEYVGNQGVVRVRLIGKLQDGVVFDQRGHRTDEPFEFVLDEEQVSDGVEEAVLTMQLGEIALFTIAPQYLQDPLVVVPPGSSSVTYEIELVSVVHEKNPRDMSRAEMIETAARKERQADELFRSSKFLRAYRRYYKASAILMARLLEDEIDEEAKQMSVSILFKAAECAIRLRCYQEAKCQCNEILRYDPGNVRARELAQQPFPGDSLGIDTDALYRGLKMPLECKQMKMAELGQKLGQKVYKFTNQKANATYTYHLPQPKVKLGKKMGVMRLMEGHQYSGRKIFVPPMKKPGADVRTDYSPATPATATNNRNNHE